MKWFIASDIHGSAYYCDLMIRRFQAEKADRMILLGDILYHGPRNDLPEEYAPKKVIEQLSAYADRILCVRGNCEAEVDQMVLPFPVLAEYALMDLGRSLLFITHGHVYHKNHLPPSCNYIFRTEAPNNASRPDNYCHIHQYNNGSNPSHLEPD